MQKQNKRKWFKSKKTISVVLIVSMMSALFVGCKKDKDIQFSGIETEKETVQIDKSSDKPEQKSKDDDIQSKPEFVYDELSGSELYSVPEIVEPEKSSEEIARENDRMYDLRELFSNVVEPQFSSYSIEDIDIYYAFIDDNDVPEIILLYPEQYYHYRDRYRDEDLGITQEVLFPVTIKSNQNSIANFTNETLVIPGSFKFIPHGEYFAFDYAYRFRDDDIRTSTAFGKYDDFGYTDCLYYDEELDNNIITNGVDPSYIGRGFQALYDWLDNDGYDAH